MTTDFHTYLLDASGVLYNDSGVIPSAVEAVASFQKRGNVFLVTNNSCHSPAVISEHLSAWGYNIPVDRIISSGYGLAQDEVIRGVIQGRPVLWFGQVDAQVYLQGTGAWVVPTIDLAEVVVIASSMGRPHLVSEVTRDLPIVCCNPDRYVRGVGEALVPVAGYFAAEIERAGAQVYWIGKPMENFSRIVQRRLERFGISLDEGVCFFDDNPDNVAALQAHLGISGCWIRETGIGRLFNPKPGLTTYIQETLTI